MSRPISTTIATTWGVAITNYMQDGSKETTPLWPGDLVEDMKYAVKKDGQEEVVVIESGKVVEAKQVFDRLTNDLHLNMTSYLTDDAKVAYIKVDASKENAADVHIIQSKALLDYPEGGSDVIRVGTEPIVKVKATIAMSDGSSEEVDLEEGLALDALTYITDKKEVVTEELTLGGFMFARGKNPNLVDVIGLICYDADKIVKKIPFKAIRSFSDGYTEAGSVEDIVNIIQEAEDGAEIKIAEDMEIKSGSNVTVSSGEVSIKVSRGTTVHADSTQTGGFSVTGDGKLVLSGGGTVESKDPYAAGHSYGLIRANGDSELVIDGINVDAVVEDDPVNKGQFGISVQGNAQCTINGGEIVCGWYCVSGNGSSTQAGSVTTINDGKLVSTVDFAIYQPGPSTLIVNGGEIIGGAGALSANNGTVIINGGTLKTLGTGDTGTWGDGTGGQADAAINLNGKYGPVSMEIHGGQILSEGGVPIIIAGTKNPVTIVIDGGSFSSCPDAAWIAEGYEAVENTSTGLWDVVKA